MDDAPGARSGAPGASVVQECCGAGCLALDDGEHVARGEHEVLLAGVLDLGAAVLAVEHLVADAHVERDAVAVLEPTRADREDDALLGLLLRGVRDHEAAGSRRLGLDGLDDDAVLERLDGDLGRGGHGASMGSYACVFLAVRRTRACRPYRSPSRGST